MPPLAVVSVYEIYFGKTPCILELKWNSYFIAANDKMEKI